MFRIRWITPDENWSDFLGDAAFHTVDQAADRATQLWANGSASQEDTLQVWQVEDADHNALVFPGPVLSLDEEALEIRAATTLSPTRGSSFGEKRSTIISAMRQSKSSANPATGKGANNEDNRNETDAD